MRDLPFTQVLSRLHQIGLVQGGESRARKKEMIKGLIRESQGQILRFLDERAKKQLGINLSSFQKATSLGATPLGDSLALVLAQHQGIKTCRGPGSNSRKIQLLSEIIHIGSTQTYRESLESYYTVGHTRVGLNQITLRQTVEELLGLDPVKINIPLYDLYLGVYQSWGDVKPMLASPYGIINPGTYAIEPKYDGIRLLIQTNPLRVTSRNGLGFPPQFYRNIDPILRELGTRPVTLDGQLWVPGSKPGEGFQTLSRVIRSKKEVELPHLRYSVFDILKTQDNLVQIGAPYARRRQILEQWFQTLQNPSLVELTQVYTRMDATDLTRPNLQRLYLERSQPGILEGLMLKDLGQPYQVGKRVTHWQKYKLETQSLDLMVIGAQRGTGRNQHRYASFDLGIRDGSQITLITQVGTGFNDQELDLLNQKYLRGDRIILEIRAQALTRSHLYPSGYSLRFPRYVRIRQDKQDPDDLQKAKLIFH